MAKTLTSLLEDTPAGQSFIVHPVLPHKGTLIIGAPPKTYKSTIEFNLAYDLASGLAIFGIDKWKPATPQTVLIVEQEFGERSLRQKMKTLNDARFGTKTITDRMHIVSKDLAVSLDNPIGINRLRHHMIESRPNVLFLDPLRKLHTLDESDSKETAKVFNVIEKIKEEFGCAVVILHHSSKKDEHRKASDPESLRGSSVIFAEADTVVMVERPIANKKRDIKLHFTLRHDEDPEPMRVQVQKDFTLQYLKAETEE